jgi:hypothetical protein
MNRTWETRQNRDHNNDTGRLQNHSKGSTIVKDNTEWFALSLLT